MAQSTFVPLEFEERDVGQMRRRADELCAELHRRRTVREFSTREVPRDVIESCVRAAGSAPSGANQQPWHFVIVSDPAIKQRIRAAAEQEEHEFYHRLATDEWLEALEPLGTDWHKPFLDTAPYLIVVFGQAYGVAADGARYKHYYVKESVGIATGMLITAVHHAGLVCLTHTPGRMGFLSEILRRPENERPFLVLVVGYPAEGVKVPDIKRKPLEQIATFV